MLECSYVNGLSAIRSLAAIGVPVIALDHRRQALGLRSRLAAPVVCPHPHEQPEEFAAMLAEICEALPHGAVAFPTHDEYLVAVNRSAPTSLRLPFGPRELIEPIQAKRFQYDAAARAGVLLPATFHPADEEAAARAAEVLRYPAVMKPSEGAGFKRRHGIPLVVAETPEELLAAYRLGAEFAPMLQEQIPGGDDCLWTVGSYVDPGGAVPGIFCGRKLLQAPAGVGTCRVGVAEWDDEAVDGARRLLHALGYHGISQVEYKRDPRDGTLRLMEVNARLWQWHSLAAACGVDLVQMAYRDAIGEPVDDADEPGCRPAPVGGARPPRAREPPRASGSAAHAGAAPPAVLRARVLAARPDARRPPGVRRPPLSLKNGFNQALVSRNNGV